MKEKFKSKSNFQLVFGQFSISSWVEKGHKLSRAELKILQLKLWLKSARLGLITTIQRTAVPFQRHFAVGSIEIQIFQNPGLNNQSILDSDTVALDHIF